MKRCKALTALTASLLCLLVLTSCSEKPRFDASFYVTGVLNETYKGTATPEFLDMVQQTEDDMQAHYMESLSAESAYFFSAWDLDHLRLTEETKENLANLFAQIYAKASYTVAPAQALSDGYAVGVTIHPITIMTSTPISLDDIQSLCPQIDENMSYLEQMPFLDDYENAWTQGLIDVYTEELPRLSYGEPVELLVHITQDKDSGLFSMSDADLARIDSLILPYS